MSYDPELIAKVKGLMYAGLSVKAAARLANIPYTTVREWRAGRRMRDIPADQSLRKTLEIYMQVPHGTCVSVVSGNMRLAQTLPAASGSETGRLR